MSLVAIVGRPNVGKSTLFNRISRTNRALVDDFPGVTRDRNYAEITWEDRTFTLVDTGGYISRESSLIEEETRNQIVLALEESDIILFVADGKTGLHVEDSVLADLVRKASKPVFFAVNKIDGPEQTRSLTEFYELGLDPIHPVSGAHGFGINDLLEALVKDIPPLVEEDEEESRESEIRVSIVGRPNVGKSTLVNRILGAPRVIVSPIPGTTRDAVDTAFTRLGRPYILIDTAGIRRKGKTTQKLEKISILKTLHSIERSHVAVLVLDALEGVTDQDLHIAGYIQERFRGCIIGINKWDVVDSDPKRSKLFMNEIKERFRFFPFAPILTFSALTGKRTSKVIPTVLEVFEQYNQRITTGVVNRALEHTLAHHEPPLVRGRPLKFYYATQASTRPPTFVLFCNHPEGIHFSYERYIVNQFREAFNLHKSPIRILFRGRQQREKRSG